MLEYPRHMDIYEMRYPSSCADGHQPVVHFLWWKVGHPPVGGDREFKRLIPVVAGGLVVLVVRYRSLCGGVKFQ